VNAAFTPEEVVALGKALDRIIENCGPVTSLEKKAIAENLLRLAQDGIWDIDRLVEMATPLEKRKRN
jgi:hypothetical protein